MTRTRILILILTAATALLLPAAALAGNGDYSGGATGPGGSTTGPGSGGGGGQVSTSDLHNTDQSPHWNENFKPLTAPGNIWTTAWLCNGMRPKILTTDNKVIGSATANVYRAYCARRVAAAMIGRPAPSNLSITGMDKYCDTILKRSPGAGVMCWYNTTRKTALSRMHAHGPASFSEIHARSAEEAGTGANLRVVAGGVNAWTIRVYRFDSSKPSSAGGHAVNQLATPIFERSVGVGYASEGAPEFTDDGLSSCGANPPGLTEGAKDGCVMQKEWWYGGDGMGPAGRNVHSADAALGVTSIGGDYSRGVARAGALSMSYTTAQKNACQSDWTARGKNELAHVRDGNGDPLVTSATSLENYVTNHMEGGNLEHLTNACYFELGAGGHREYTNPRGTVKPGTASELGHESIAVGWSINNGGQSQLAYRIQGTAGMMYMVQIVALDSREQIVGHRTTDAFFAPGAIGLETSCIQHPATCPTPANPGGGAGGRDHDGDDTPGDAYVPAGDLTGDDSTLGDVFPEITASLSAPSSSATGRPVNWFLAGRPQQPMTASQAIRPLSTTFQLAEPQVATYGWATDLLGNVYFPSMFRARIQGRSATPTFVPSVGWPIPGADSMRYAMSLSGLVGEATVPSSYPADVYDQPYLTSALTPSRSERDPMYGIGAVSYESGRFVDDLRRLRDGAAVLATDQITAQDSYPLAKDVSGPAQMVSAYFLARGECAARPAGAGGACATAMVDTNTPAAVARIDVVNRADGTVYSSRTNFQTCYPAGQVPPALRMVLISAPIAEQHTELMSRTAVRFVDVRDSIVLYGRVIGTRDRVLTVPRSTGTASRFYNYNTYRFTLAFPPSTAPASSATPNAQGLVTIRDLLTGPGSPNFDSRRQVRVSAAHCDSTLTPVDGGYSRQLIDISNVPAGAGADIRVYFTNTTVAAASAPRYRISAQQWRDGNDRWQWAGDSVGPDNDPQFGIERPGGAAAACPSGECRAWSDYQRLLVLGNQPSQ